MVNAPARVGTILGIESSCDETAAAVVRGGREILSSVVHSQTEEHAPFGGVVPEVAGRSHLRNILPVIDAALDQAGLSLDTPGDLDGIAVTTRPGLIGSLLVGLSAAKALAWAKRLPLIGVHHIEAHAFSPLMAAAPEGTDAPLELPAICLVVSGGHTALYRMESPGEMELLCATLDDAAGEAFDKVAHMLGLPYPGGPEISRLAENGDPGAIAFPRYRPRNGSLGFSFSGLKTAVLYHLRGQDALAPSPRPEDIERPMDVAASFEAAVVDALVHQTLAAAQEEGLGTVLISGGVACNRRLRQVMSERGQREGLVVGFPAPALCTDNAAMIAGLGHHLWAAGKSVPLDVDASPH